MEVDVSDQESPQKPPSKGSHWSHEAAPILWIAFAGLLVSWIVTSNVAGHHSWIAPAFMLGLVFILGLLIRHYKKALLGRSGIHGIHSVSITLLVASIIGVVNFIAYRYPYKMDWTKNRSNTLTQQTQDVLTGLSQPITARFFANLEGKQQYQDLLQRYREMNPKFQLEFIDPDLEQSKVKQFGIGQYNTLHLQFGNRSDKVTLIEEEQITNKILRLTQSEVRQICVITGHGEKDWNSNAKEGFKNIHDKLVAQGTQIRFLDLPQAQEIPKSCHAIAILGPTKAFFPREVELIQKYLDHGGRALFALDIEIDLKETAPEMAQLLEDWNLRVEPALIIEEDLRNRFGQVDATVPMINDISGEHPITRGFKQKLVFPVTRPIQVTGRSKKKLNHEWLARTSSSAWGETDPQSVRSGKVHRNPSDIAGPHIVAVAIEEKTDHNQSDEHTNGHANGHAEGARLVVFGNSHFASQYNARFGQNLDLFMNSVNWVLEDDHRITIRKQNVDVGVIELSASTGNLIFWATVVFVPGLIISGGILNWTRRRKL